MEGVDKTIYWRTAQQCCDIIKEKDPLSVISRFYIVKLANSQKIRSLKSGRKIMVDYLSLDAYLKGIDYEYPAGQITIKYNEEAL